MRRQKTLAIRYVVVRVVMLVRALRIIVMVGMPIVNEAGGLQKRMRRSGQPHGNQKQRQRCSNPRHAAEAMPTDSQWKPELFRDTRLKRVRVGPETYPVRSDSISENFRKKLFASVRILSKKPDFLEFGRCEESPMFTGLWRTQAHVYEWSEAGFESYLWSHFQWLVTQQVAWGELATVSETVSKRVRG